MPSKLPMFAILYEMYATVFELRAGQMETVRSDVLVTVTVM